MNVIQFASNQVMTRKAAPVLTSSSLNAPSYNKNENAIISFDFTNTDSANITNLNINNSITVPDSSSSTILVTTTNSVGNNASQTVDDFNFTITSFAYFDGFEEKIFNILPIIELAYSVLKETPIAEVPPLSIIADDTAVTFNVTNVIDPDFAISSSQLTVVIYEQGQNTLIATSQIGLTGADDISITGLSAATDYQIAVLADYNTINGTPVTQGNILTSTPLFTTTPSQDVAVSSLNISATTNSITIEDMTLTDSFANIVSGQVIMTQTGSGVTETYTFSQSEIAEIIAGNVTTPILLSNSLISNTPYQLTFEFTSASGMMRTVQPAVNAISTRKVAPIAGPIGLVNDTLTKNNDSEIVLNITTNTDSAAVSNLIINGVAVAVDNTSDLAASYVFQDVGNIASTVVDDKVYEVSGYTYNDGFADVQLTFDTATTLNYTVIKDTPAATLSNVVVATSDIKFDYQILPSSEAITAVNLIATVYARGDQTTPVNQETLSNIEQGSNIIIAGLAPDTEYDLYITTTYDTLSGGSYPSNILIPAQPFATNPEDSIVIDSLSLSSTTSNVTIVSAQFSNEYSSVVSGEIIIYDRSGNPLVNI